MDYQKYMYVAFVLISLSPLLSLLSPLYYNLSRSLPLSLFPSLSLALPLSLSLFFYLSINLSFSHSFFLSSSQSQAAPLKPFGYLNNLWKFIVQILWVLFKSGLG